jgi:hypothetical protein
VPTTLPIAGYLVANERTQGQFKQAIEDWLAYTKQMPGGSAVGAGSIAAGVVTPQTPFFRSDTEAAAGTDNLTNIAVTYMGPGSLLFLSQTDASRVVTLVHGDGGTGGVDLLDAANFVFTSVNDWVLFAHAAECRELVRFVAGDDRGFDRRGDHQFPAQREAALDDESEPDNGRENEDDDEECFHDSGLPVMERYTAGKATLKQIRQRVK